MLDSPSAWQHTPHRRRWEPRWRRQPRSREMRFAHHAPPPSRGIVVRTAPRHRPRAHAHLGPGEPTGRAHVARRSVAKELRGGRAQSRSLRRARVLVVRGRRTRSDRRRGGPPLCDRVPRHRAVVRRDALRRGRGRRRPDRDRVAIAGQAISPEVWRLGRQTTYLVLNVYAMRMAGAFTISPRRSGTASASFHDGWWCSDGVIAVVLLLTIERFAWVQILFPVWVLVLSIHLLVHPPRMRLREDVHARATSRAALEVIPPGAMTAASSCATS